MPGLDDLLYGVLVPAILCGVILALVWASWGPGVESSATRRHLQALAFAAGVLAGYVAIVGAPVLPSETRRLAALDWMPWLVLAALIVSLVQATKLARRVPSVVPIAIVCVLVPTLSFLGRDSGFAILTTALVLLLVWRAANGLANKLPGPAVPIALWIVATCTSVASVFAHSAKIGQLSGALAACLGAAAALAFWNPRLTIAGGGVAIVITVLGVCWINAVHFADLPPIAGALLALAIVLPSLLRIAPTERWSRTKRIFACALFAALPAAAAVVIAHRSAPSYEF